jgi:hypothetical protein
MNQSLSHPDLLRRFVVTPYLFVNGSIANQLHIQSNDLEIALSLRRSHTIQQCGMRTGRLLCKVIRDLAGPVDRSEVFIFSTGELRILHMGRGTVLMYDRERCELLGFVSTNVKAHELTSSLIPAVLDL